MIQQTRTEKDSIGELEIPINALYGIQTQRAINNFPISNTAMPNKFITSLAYVKASCAKANFELNLMPKKTYLAIQAAAKEIIAGKHLQQFPVDVFQTGSGTSTNMNINEVIANIASSHNNTIHPNNDVNMSQSSNDVIPTAINLSASIELEKKLLPALKHLVKTIKLKEQEVKGIIKTGRTHLMDATPIKLSQELSAWRYLIKDNIKRLNDTKKRVRLLPQGATAVGTGINADPNFGSLVCEDLTKNTAITFKPMKNLFVGLSTQDTTLELSGQLNVLAASLMKMANDLRWMNSGPLAGLGEIQLATLQPGSSIMPGKVNPVIPEAVCMVAAQIMGNHNAITIGAQSGNFQLNVMLPMIASNLIQSLEIATNATIQLAEQAIKSFSVNTKTLQKTLATNPILVTSLNRIIGYETGAAIAKKAYQTNRPILEIAKELTDLGEETLKKYLNPAILTKGGNINP